MAVGLALVSRLVERDFSRQEVQLRPYFSLPLAIDFNDGLDTMNSFYKFPAGFVGRCHQRISN